MKALSIQQPWAHAILHGTKRVENRTWGTRFRGPVLIHAGKKLDGEACEYLASPYERWEYTEEQLRNAPRGAILGVCRIVDCVSDDVASPEHGTWAMGPYCFVLDSVTPFDEPIPFKGALGFFDVPDDVVAEQLQLARVRYRVAANA